MPDSNCPNREILSRYANGSLDDHSAEVLDRHLSVCETCLNVLETNLEVDSLVSDLRKTTDVKIESSSYQKVFSRLTSNFDDIPHIPGYEILEVIGVGGMGTVYKAHHTKLGKPVAIKVIRGHRDPTAVIRFEREMKAVGRLDHPNVVRASDAGDADGVPYLVMEYVSGIDLSKLVKEQGPLPFEKAKGLILQLATGLEAAHAQGIIHRDVKPSNAILTADGSVKLLDLGLALLPSIEPVEAAIQNSPRTGKELTHAGRAMGTKDYMAPEQATHPQLANARADIYGLGATLWYLQTGQPPSRPIETYPAGLPAEIWQKLLADGPDNRFASMAEAMTAIRSITTVDHSSKGTRRIWLLLSLAILTVSIALIFLNWRVKNPSTYGNQQLEESTLPSLRTIPLSEDEAKELQSLWAARMDWNFELSRNQLGMQFALIPPGIIPLSPQCRATISKPYELGMCEVTIGQFKKFIDDTGYRTSAESDGEGGFFLDWAAPAGKKFKSGPQYNWRTPGHQELTDNHPVSQVTWNDAVAFCAWLSKKEGHVYRLPTEAEWQWASRCGEGGDLIAKIARKRTDDAEALLWIRSTVGKKITPHPVGLLRANLWGLHDMWGNIMEMCADEFDQLPEMDVVDYCCQGTHHQYHVLHGYSFQSTSLTNEGSRGSMQKCNDAIGFRVLREIR